LLAPAGNLSQIYHTTPVAGALQGGEARDGVRPARSRVQNLPHPLPLRRQGYFRSLNTKSEAEAHALCGRAESVIRAISQGFLTIPPDADPGDFILAGGQSIQPSIVIDRPKSITLAALFDAYERELTPGAKEANTRQTERVHRTHLLGHFGRLDAAALDHRAVQDYVNARGMAAKTLRLELGTLRMVWNWGLANGHITAPLPFEMRRLTFPKGTAREPFQTWEQIERKLEALRRAKKLTPEREASLWETLYLSEAQVQGCLDHVRRKAGHPFVYPMFAFCAYTGARRSEILRSEREDWDFKADTVAVRQKKSDTSRTFTLCHVSIHPALAEAMAEWFKNHPGTAPTICTANGAPISPRMATKYFTAALRGSEWEVIPGFHCFRHSVASIMATKGIDQRVINKILGHSTQEMERRYQHLFPAKQQESIRQLFGQT
jgi:integrase